MGAIDITKLNTHIFLETDDPALMLQQSLNSSKRLVQDGWRSPTILQALPNNFF
ncbi:hypothetical protein ACQ4M4_01885 [Leptolyngbya sp. AN02str]|uniref:hypothetical protein n=1 Tax=Leptolyngbya sp. AN02str TaxID=3423363 RepID=UPI003D31249B